MATLDSYKVNSLIEGADDTVITAGELVFSRILEMEALTYPLRREYLTWLRVE